MIPGDRNLVTEWLASHLVPTEGAYVFAYQVQNALLQDTGIYVSVTMLGHLVQARRAQSGIVLYLDRTLVP